MNTLNKKIRLSKVEKFLISDIDTEKFNTYHCKEHGIYQILKSNNDSKCLYCKKEHEPIENIQELKEHFKN